MIDFGSYGYVAWQETMAYRAQLLWLQQNALQHDKAFKDFVKRLGNQIEGYVTTANNNIAKKPKQETFMQAATRFGDKFEDYNDVLKEIRALVKKLLQ